MVVIIAGSRDFNDYETLKSYCDHILINFPDVTIVSGTARGADQLGERYAEERGFKLLRFPADWSLGRNAGHIRNRQMAENADALIAFWDGESKGTKNMIETANQLGLLVRTYKYDNN